MAALERAGKLVTTLGGVVVYFFVVMIGVEIDPREGVAAGLVLLFAGLVVLLVGVGMWVAAVLVAGRRGRAAATMPQPARLEWAPGSGVSWLPAEDWVRLPDPLPAHPLPRTVHRPVTPHGPVPPDEVLRKLWLVRAHIRALRAANATRARDGSAMRLTVSFFGALSWLVFWSSVVALPGMRFSDPLDWACAFVPALPALVTCVQARVLSVRHSGVRRYRALGREQRRLAELDTQRPSGPAGGPNVAAGLPPRGSDGSKGYTPPRLPENAVGAPTGKV